MPLSEKLRVELFIPDSPDPAYSQLTNELEVELAYTFGGSSTIQGMKGLYSDRGKITQDRIHLVFTDVALSVSNRRELVAAYVEALHDIVFSALKEEKVLIVVYVVYHLTAQNVL